MENNVNDTPVASNEDTLTRREVARLLEIGLQSVYLTMKQDPSFPHPVRIGKKDYWLREHVVAWKRAKVASVSAENAKRLEMITRGAEHQARIAPAKGSKR